MIKPTESESTRRRKNLSRSNKLARKKRRLMMEGLENRQLLAAVPVSIPAVDPTLFLPQVPRNIGTVQAFAFNEPEIAGQSGANDSIQQATLVPLGTLPGQQDTIDINGTMSIAFSPQGNLTADQDVFAFDLRAGDILDVAVIGAVNNLTILNADGSIWFGTDENTGLLNPVTLESGHPDVSPLMTFGNAVAAQVVPRTGRYYLQMAPTTSTAQYTLGLRVYRPVAESLPIGAQQYLFIDFDGGFYPTSVFSSSTLPPGIVRFSSLEQNLPLIGLTNPQPGDLDQLIDKIIAEVERHFRSVARNGGNGDYDSTGNPGDFGITILNSRDHVDPGFFNPLVSRVIVGGTAADSGVTDLGLAQSIDIGNFDMSEIAIAPIDGYLALATQFPISPSKSILDALAVQLAGTVTHEASHTFGLRHTDGNNTVGSIIDQGSASLDAYLAGIGIDGIFGTADDMVAEFTTDEFAVEPPSLVGFEYTAEAMAYVLSTGTVGGSISGRAFNDLNGDGRSTTDRGLAGVTVFADVNGNGIQDLTDPTTVTGGDGTFTLGVAPGTYDVIAVTPVQFAATTATTMSATVSLNATASGIEFGFNQVIPDITGTKFADNNGNGLFDPGEPGIGGVYIYLDLDADNRPDLGEPAAVSEADGTYSINFPGPGTYTIREVIGSGFIQTFPGESADFEHVVVFDGTALTQNYDFGNLPSRDFGDAPDSYGTLEASGGPSHGITAGLTLGAIVDRELDGQPNATATGDDINGRVDFNGTVLDDEDGLRLLSPLGPGDSAQFEVTVTNTTGSPAYLQAWMDFNIDGKFDANERFATDVQLATGTYTLPVFVPASARVGTTYVRLRYSQTPGLGVGGEADTGEVEDYSFPILSAAEVANNDQFMVSRNTQANQLDVLANDFQTIDNQLTITGRDISGTAGSVVIAADGKSVFYTPPTGFIGRDVFGYTVRDQFGRFSTATVVVNVTFQSAIPIAVDDSFEVPEGSVNRALNVLDNDVPSISGGLSITSVTPGDNGGTLNIVGGGQSIRYTPLPGFNGTEQFTYSVQDAVGSVSTAEVTINLLPGSRRDDVVDFSIGIFDVINDRPITNVQVGDVFNVRVFVDDLRTVAFGSPEGVASAFLDLLYTDELIATRDTDNNPNFPFDITFGPLFSGGGTFQQADSQTPGLLNEIGAVQPILDQMEHTGPVELLTVTMQAVSPGVAVFQADPADAIQSETAVLGEDRALAANELRLGNAELNILPSSTNFASAIDDSFPDRRDSNGNLILGNATTPARLDVLANDNFGATGTINEFGLVTSPALGNATINDNGTPGFLNDDFIDYVADVNANGFDQFTYVIVSADGITSTAEVTLAVGNAGNDDLVAIDFGLVNSNGSPNTTGVVNVGDRIGIQVIVEDLRPGLDLTFVFAGFLDVLYDSGILSPANTITGDDFDFDVVFAPDFNESAAVGTAVRPGIIDEFGTLLVQSIAESGSVDNPNLMATLFFNVIGSGSTRVVGGPADASPFQDTLLFREDDPVPVDQIRYDVLNITVSGGEGEVLHNARMPGDVNDDGDISAIDALLVINHLGREGGAEGEDVITARKYYDVSGDGKASSLDALLVINSLSRNQLMRESEWVVASVSKRQASADDPVSSSDAVFANLSESRPVGDTADQANDPTGAVINPVGTDSDSHDDEDDVFALLADDVSGLWS